MMQSWVVREYRLLPAVVLVLLTGCASLPDMTPYRDATVQLRSLLLAGGGAVQAGVETAAAGHEADSATARRIGEQTERFVEDWRARVEGADALVAYTDAVAEIARSGMEGAASARSLADALFRLASGADIALPPSGTVAAVTDTAAFVYRHIAATRAAPSLQQALQAAQPAVDGVSVMLAQDLQATLAILRSVHELQHTALALRYNEETGYLKALEHERKALHARGSLGANDEARLQRIAELIEATRAWREPLQSAQAAIDKELRLRLALIEATRTAVAEWAAAHSNLVAALLEKRAVDVEALVQATLEARELVRRLRAL
ncbi:MAG: hypothetical protein ACUVT2_02720 [Thiobacillaceae bacterium]